MFVKISIFVMVKPEISDGVFLCQTIQELSYISIYSGRLNLLVFL